MNNVIENDCKMNKNYALIIPSHLTILSVLLNYKYTKHYHVIHRSYHIYHFIFFFILFISFF